MKFQLSESDMATLKAGSLIERIRVFRSVTGWDLRMAKEACEAIIAGRMKLEEFFIPKSPCPACQGTGFVTEKASAPVAAAPAWPDPAEGERIRLLDLVEKFKCSERAETCSARHMGYNLAIDDVLELLRGAKPPTGVVVKVGADGKACCAACGKQDYPLENHKCEA